MAQRPTVTVLGSLNTDISLLVPHLPEPGETVLASAAAIFGAGGKGANQAVAAARLGAAVSMVGCCGDDEFGARLRAGLDGRGDRRDRPARRARRGLGAGPDHRGSGRGELDRGRRGRQRARRATRRWRRRSRSRATCWCCRRRSPSAVLGAALRRARAEGVAHRAQPGPGSRGSGRPARRAPGLARGQRAGGGGPGGRPPERPGRRAARAARQAPEGRRGRRWARRAGRRRWGRAARRGPPAGLAAGSAAGMSWSRWARRARCWPGRRGRPPCPGSG